MRNTLLFLSLAAGLAIACAASASAAPINAAAVKEVATTASQVLLRRSRVVLKGHNALQCAIVPFGFNSPAILIV